MEDDTTSPKNNPSMQESCSQGLYKRPKRSHNARTRKDLDHVLPADDFRAAAASMRKPFKSRGKSRSNSSISSVNSQSTQGSPRKRKRNRKSAVNSLENSHSTTGEDRYRQHSPEILELDSNFSAVGNGRYIKKSIKCLETVPLNKKTVSILSRFNSNFETTRKTDGSINTTSKLKRIKQYKLKTSKANLDSDSDNVFQAHSKYNDVLDERENLRTLCLDSSENINLEAGRVGNDTVAHEVASATTKMPGSKRKIQCILPTIHGIPDTPGITLTQKLHYSEPNRMNNQDKTEFNKENARPNKLILSRFKSRSAIPSMTNITEGRSFSCPDPETYESTEHLNVEIEHIETPIPIKKRKHTRATRQLEKPNPPFVKVGHNSGFDYAGVNNQYIQARPCYFESGGRPVAVPISLKVHFDNQHAEQWDVRWYIRKEVDIVHFQKFFLPQRIENLAQYIGHGLYVPEKCKGHQLTKSLNSRKKYVKEQNGHNRARRIYPTSSRHEHDTGEDVDSDSCAATATAAGKQNTLFLYSQTNYANPPKGKAFKVYVLILCKLCRKNDATESQHCLLWIGKGNASKFDRHVAKAHPVENLRLNSPGQHNRFMKSLRQDFSYANFVNRLFDVIVSTNQSIRWVEHPSVRNLIRETYGSCVGLPHRRAFLTHLETMMEEKLPEKWAEIRNSIACGTIMMDTWKNKRQKSILAVYLAYTDYEFRCHEVCLRVAVLEGPATGACLCDAVINIVTECGLKDKLNYCLSDSGSNVLKAFNLYENWLDTSSDNSTQGQTIEKVSTVDAGGLNLPNAYPQDHYEGKLIPIIDCEGYESDFSTIQDEEYYSEDKEEATELSFGAVPNEDNEADYIHMQSPNYLIQSAADTNINFIPSAQCFAVKVHTQYRCAAHLLQLIVSPSIVNPSTARPSVRNLVLYVLRITTFIRKRVALMNQLVALTGKGLIQPNQTRWNSFIDAIGRLAEPEMFAAVKYILEDHKSKCSATERKGMPEIPTSEVFQKIQQLFRILLPLAVATDNLQTDGISSHLLIYEILIAYTYIHYVRDLEEDLEETKKILLKEMRERFSPIFKCEVFVAATLLNPKTKRMFEWVKKVMPFDPFDCPTQDEAVTIVRSLMPDYVLQEANVNITPHDMKLKRGNNFVPMAATVSVKSPFDTYLSEPVDGYPLDLPEYWRARMHDWPALASFVRSFCFPATTGSVERLFSRLKLIIRDQRSNLDTKIVNKLVHYDQFFLHKDTKSTIVEIREKRFTKIRNNRQLHSSNFSLFHTGELDASTGEVTYGSYLSLEDYPVDINKLQGRKTNDGLPAFTSHQTIRTDIDISGQCPNSNEEVTAENIHCDIENRVVTPRNWEVQSTTTINSENYMLEVENQNDSQSYNIIEIRDDHDNLRIQQAPTSVYENPQSPRGGSRTMEFMGSEGRNYECIDSESETENRLSMRIADSVSGIL